MICKIFSLRTPKKHQVALPAALCLGFGLAPMAQATRRVGTGSSKPLTLPAGVMVVAAYPYSFDSGPTADATVGFQGNNTGDARFTDTFDLTGYKLSRFGAHEDITSEVATNGSA